MQYFDYALNNNEVSVLEVLYNLSGNPVIRERKMQMYKSRELKQLGVK